MLAGELFYRWSSRARAVLSEEQRETMERRRRLSNATTLTVGVAVALVSGAANSFWYNAALTIVALVFWVPGAFLAFGVLRGKRASA